MPTQELCRIRLAQEVLFGDQLTCMAPVGVRFLIPSSTLALQPCVYKKNMQTPTGTVQVN